MSSTYVPPPGVRAPLFAPGKLELKYLFGAVFNDGTQLFQTTEDESQFVKGKNAVYDLLEHDEDGNCIQHPVDNRLIFRSDIMLFVLQNSRFRYLLDLRDGHFEVQHHIKDDIWEGAHLYLDFPPPGAKIRLFYFRRRRHHAILTGTVQEDMSVKEDVVEHSQECEYHFGWETESKSHKGELILV